MKIVVPYAPGGANDVIARFVAQALSERLKQPFVVENRPGASGIVGTTFVARSKPDGYTLLMGASGAMTINPSLNPNLSYDVQRDFVPVGSLSWAGMVMVVPSSLQVSTLAQFIEHARGPKGISYASPGQGTPLHLAGELFMRQAGIKGVHVPYKGSTPAIADLVAGRVDLTFDGVIVTMPFIRDGRLIPLAVTTPQRLAELPKVPTLQESGFKDFDVGSWSALFAPAGTPREIVQVISSELEQVCASASMKENFATVGLGVRYEKPEQLGQRVERETARWRDLIAQADIKVE